MTRWWLFAALGGAAALLSSRPAASSGRPSALAGAVASRGGARLSVDLRDLSMPRPGVAHRTFYRVSRSRSTTETSESRSRSASVLSLRPRGTGWSSGATLNAPLTGEATLGSQPSGVRMTDPRSCGDLCLNSPTANLPTPFPFKHIRPDLSITK